MASAPYIKVLALTKRLHNATVQGLIHWESTDRGDTFAYSTPSSSVLVSSVDNDGRVPYEIQVIDDKGNVIESMVSHRKNNLTRQYDLAAGGKLLSELYEYARREALGVDEKLDALLADLPPLPHDEDEFVEEDTEDT